MSEVSVSVFHRVGRVGSRLEEIEAVLIPLSRGFWRSSSLQVTLEWLLFLHSHWATIKPQELPDYTRLDQAHILSACQCHLTCHTIEKPFQL